MSPRKSRKSSASKRTPKASPGGAAPAGPRRASRSWWIGGIAAVAIAVVAFAVGREYIPGWQVANAVTDDGGGLVVEAGSFRAIHEMKGGPRIRFLPTDAPQPKIEVPMKVHDFGSLSPKAVVSYTFLIRNVGAAPLRISRAFTTCGCTTAEVSARVIPAGKAARVKLRFDAGFHDARGKRVKRGLVIESNDRTNSKTTVWTRASIRRS